MTIKDWQKRTDEWINEYGVRYFDPMTNTVLLMEEIGEFSRLMARKYGEQSFKRKEDVDKIEENIEEEIADIFFVLTCLSNQMGVDIEGALEKSMVKKTRRDENRHKQNEKLR